MRKGFKEAQDLPRRFYKTAAAAGTAVHLDGRAPKSPAGRPLVLPTEALARMLAAEWEGQDGHILMSSMPATRLAFTVLDRLEAKHAETAAEVARYANSDLLCYFADTPQTLVARQEARWGPMLEWAHDDLGLIFQRVGGLIHRDQAPETLAKVRELAGALDGFALAGLAHATALFGSAVLGFALHRGRLSAGEAFGLSRIDEAFQEEQWGVDEEAADRTAGLAEEARMLERWFAALR